MGYSIGVPLARQLETGLRSYDCKFYEKLEGSRERVERKGAERSEPKCF